MSSKPNITSASKPVVLAETIINKIAEKLKVPTKQAQRILKEVDRLQMMATAAYYRAKWRGCDSRSVPTKQAQGIDNEEDRQQMMANSDYYRAEWSGCNSRSVPTKQAQSVANKEERLHMIATSDYYRAERSGGVRSDEIQDWLEEAGEEIDNTTP